MGGRVKRLIGATMLTTALLLSQTSALMAHETAYCGHSDTIQNEWWGRHWLDYRMHWTTQWGQHYHRYDHYVDIYNDGQGWIYDHTEDNTCPY